MKKKMALTKKDLRDTRRLLIKANQLLTKESWIQEEERLYADELDETKCTHMCAIGAVMESRDQLRLSEAAYQTARKFLDDAVAIQWKKAHPEDNFLAADIVEYNDEFAQDVTDVKKVFAAARRAVDREILKQ